MSLGALGVREGMIDMTVLVGDVVQDYVGTCEVLRSEPGVARLRLSPEAGGRGEGREPVVVVLSLLEIPASSRSAGVDLVLVTRVLDGVLDAHPVLVSPVPSAIIALALR